MLGPDAEKEEAEMKKQQYAQVENMLLHCVL